MTLKQVLILKAELLLVHPIKVFISRPLFASSLQPFNCQSIPGELYFLATGAPSATTRAGFIYKIVDPSRYLRVKEIFNLTSCAPTLWWFLTDASACLT